VAEIVIDEVDPRSVDDATAAALAELRTIQQAEIAPEDPPVAPAEVADELRAPPDHVEHAVWLAHDGDRRRPLGALELEVEHRQDNRHLAWVEPVVRPDARRAGVGGALVEAASAWAAERGRTTLMGGAAVGTEGALAARALGGEVALVDRLSRLRTAELDRPLLERWVGGAAERARDYSLVAFDDRCPDDLVDRFARVVGVMNTAPRGDMDVEDLVATPDIIRAHERSWAARGVRTWVLCARHDPTDELVGLTAFELPKHRPWKVEQGDTGVHPEHRRRGLGRWLKAVNLLRLLDERPDVRVVDTENAGVNRDMLSINEALGFRPLAEIEVLQVRLPVSAPRASAEAGPGR